MIVKEIRNLSYAAIYLPVGTSTTNFDWYVESFTLAFFLALMELTICLYQVQQEKIVLRYDFLIKWSNSPNSNQGYSLTPGVVEGDDGVGFNDFPLNSSTNIVWQPIARNVDYGFGTVLLQPMHQWS